MNNPFKYGEVALEEAFCNRKQEISRMHQAFSDGQNIVLISPRRWGKSSLVDEALAKYKEQIYLVKLDCFGMRSSEQFTQSLLDGILRATSSKVDDFIENTKKFLRSLAPYISISTGVEGEVSIGITRRQSDVDINEILEMANKISKSKKKGFVICVDEFQKISEWEGGGPFLELLRAKWQKHRYVSYCLYGSKRSLMHTIFSSSSEPFYRFGESVFLEKIDKDDWAPFLQKQFGKANKRITYDNAAYLVEKVNGHSYFVQYLARISWNISKGIINTGIIDESFKYLLNDHVSIFLRQADRLTKYQVNYLKAFISGETKMTSQQVMRQYDLGSQGNIKRIEKALYDSEILDFYKKPYEFFDPYFQPLFRDRFMR